MSDSQPNILFILPDQLRRDVVGAYGSEVCRTPHLDRLADEGVRCDMAYTACGLCSPTRASILTGKFPHNHGLLTNIHDRHTLVGMPTDHATWGQRLSEAGYQTGYVGKWHVSAGEGPADYGFADDFADHKGLAEYRAEHGLAPGEPDVTVAATMPMGEVRPLAGTYTGALEGYSDYYLCVRARELLADYIRETRASGRPFCLRLDTPGPHIPNIIPEPYASMYDPATVPLWSSQRDSLAGKPAIVERLRRAWGTDSFSDEDWGRLIACYFGDVTLIDDLIGQLIADLDASGLAENTLVIVSTDHGDNAGSRRMVDKGYHMCEETYHIPLIARWPAGLPAGASTAAPISHVDYAPTLLAAAGAEPLPDIDGRDALPALRGNTPADWPDDSFAEFHGMQWGLYSQRMLRSERYKLVFNALDPAGFYDLETDPDELENLIDSADHQAVIEDHWRRLVAAMKRTRDPFYEDLFTRGACDPDWVPGTHPRAQGDSPLRSARFPR